MLQQQLHSACDQKPQKINEISFIQIKMFIAPNVHTEHSVWCEQAFSQKSNAHKSQFYSKLY